MNNIWAEWLEDNYKYIVMAMQTTEKDRLNVLKLADICEKHGVSLKTYLDILTEFGKEDDDA